MKAAGLTNSSASREAFDLSCSLCGAKLYKSASSMDDHSKEKVNGSRYQPITLCYTAPMNRTTKWVIY